MREQPLSYDISGSVPKIVLILCSIFWKIELLTVCGLYTGPEMPTNDDQFTRIVAKKMYQYCCNPGERLALESRVFIHAID